MESWHDRVVYFDSRRIYGMTQKESFMIRFVRFVMPCAASEFPPVAFTSRQLAQDAIR